jgi:hypothetical protein
MTAAWLYETQVVLSKSILLRGRLTAVTRVYACVYDTSVRENRTVAQQTKCFTVPVLRIYAV